MYPFSYTKASDIRSALAAGRRGGRYIAGGTTLVDLMRETVERPDELVDISALPLREITRTGRGGLRIGALVRMADAAAHPVIRAEYWVIAEALELSASAQLRNMATIGGNIMQRTRCAYFRDVTSNCNKRAPGSGCAAREGINRNHAILGTSDACVCTHPSDVAVAFAALEATVHLVNPDGERLRALQDDRVWFFGQPVAVVVATTLEAARHAARLVEVGYAAEQPVFDLSAAPAREPETYARGDADTDAAVRLEMTFRTARNHHNAMEPHAIIARWDGDRLTVWDKTQWVADSRNELAAVFGIPKDAVRCFSRFVGGAFGNGGRTWVHSVIAAMAAREVRRPVKLVLTRKQQYVGTGFRPAYEYKVDSAPTGVGTSTRWSTKSGASRPATSSTPRTSSLRRASCTPRPTSARRTSWCRST